MSGVWSQLQATLGETSQGPWVRWTIIPGEVWDASEPAVVRSLCDGTAEADRAAVETLGESADVSEGTGGEKTGAGSGGTDEKDEERESVGREQSLFLFS